MKRFLAILCVFITFMNVFCYAFEDENYLTNGKSFITDFEGQQIELNHSILILGGKIAVPIMEISQPLGLNTQYDAANKTIKINTDNKTLVTKLNNTKYTVNNEEKTIDIAPSLYGDVIMISLDFLANNFKYEYRAYWDKYKGYNVLHINKKINNEIEKIYDCKAVISDGYIGNFKEPVYKIDGTMYVPIEKMGDILNKNVTVDTAKESGQINITTNTGDIKTVGSTELKAEGVIPDEKTAYTVGKTLLEAYAGRSMEYSNQYIDLYLETVYVDDLNCWKISQEYKLKTKPDIGGSGQATPEIFLDKATGKVIRICTDMNIYEKRYGNKL